MVLPSLKKALLSELENLGNEDQHRVLDFARALARARVVGTPGRDLLGFAGTISDEDADAMSRAIEEECERIDPDGW